MERTKRHIRDYTSKINISFIEANGVQDHFHLLIDLPPAKSAAEAINLIKGESSHWLNSGKFVPGGFSWENGYSVFSVSESQLEKVIEYISGQQQLHQKISFQEEMAILYKKHNLIYIPKGH